MDRELVQYLDQRFQTIDLRFQAIDQKLQAHDQRFVSLEELIRTSSEETKRHTGVLVEGLRHEVQLLAEGLGTHIEAERSRHVAIKEQFRETQALIHLSYDQLRQRVENLERRGQN